MSSTAVDAALLVLRLQLGVLLIAHAVQKTTGWLSGAGFPASSAAFEALGHVPGRPMVALASLCELAAAVSLLAGFLTPLGAAVGAGTLLVAGGSMTARAGRFWNALGGGEYATSLAVTVIAIGIAGPGRWSVDAALSITWPSWIGWAAAAVAVAAAVGPIMRSRRNLKQPVHAERALARSQHRTATAAPVPFSARPTTNGASMPIKPRRRRTLAATAITAAAAAALLSACSNATTAATSSAHGKVAVQNVGSVSQLLNSPASVCGTKPTVVGIADGLGQNSWSAVSFAAVKAEAGMCKNVTKILTTSADGDPATAISDINSLVSRGANVITVIPDAGPVASVMRKAMQSGVSVITWGAPAAGATVGPDMVDNVQINRVHDGLLYGQWLTRVLKGHGNVVEIGGPAGNSLTPLTHQGVLEAFQGHPGMKLLNSSPAVTNWDAASTQQAMAALLAKYPNIDGIVTESVQNLPGIIAAYQNANRPLVPVTMEDGQISPTDTRLAGACLYAKYKPTNPGFQIAATSSGNFVGQVAFRKAMAYYQGLADSEPSNLNSTLIEDSAAGGSLAPKC